MPSKRAHLKPIDRLRAKDIEAHGLWRFADGAEGVEGQDETSVEPVTGTSVPLDAEVLFVAATFTGPTGRDFVGLVQVFLDSTVRVTPCAIVTDAVYAPLPDPGHWMEDSTLRYTESKLSLSRKELYPLSYTLRHLIEGEAEPRTGVFRLEATGA